MCFLTLDMRFNLVISRPITSLKPKHENETFPEICSRHKRPTFSYYPILPLKTNDYESISLGESPRHGYIDLTTPQTLGTRTIDFSYAVCSKVSPKDFEKVANAYTRLASPQILPKIITVQAETASSPSSVSFLVEDIRKRVKELLGDSQEETLTKKSLEKSLKDIIMLCEEVNGLPPSPPLDLSGSPLTEQSTTGFHYLSTPALDKSGKSKVSRTKSTKSNECKPESGYQGGDDSSSRGGSGGGSSRGGPRPSGNRARNNRSGKQNNGSGGNKSGCGTNTKQQAVTEFSDNSDKDWTDTWGSVESEPQEETETTSMFGSLEWWDLIGDCESWADSELSEESRTASSSPIAGEDIEEWIMEVWASDLMEPSNDSAITPVANLMEKLLAKDPPVENTVTHSSLNQGKE